MGNLGKFPGIAPEESGHSNHEDQREVLLPVGASNPTDCKPAVLGGFLMKLIDRIALVLVILGGLNWGCVGIFGLDLVAALFGGSASVLGRVVYVLICLAALWCITLFFREEPVERRAKGNA